MVTVSPPPAARPAGRACRRGPRRRRRRSTGPSPAPASEPVRSAPSRRNGRPSSATCAWSSTAPPVATTRLASRRRTRPDTDPAAAALCTMALSITLSTIRASRAGLPSAQALSAAGQPHAQVPGRDRGGPLAQRARRPASPGTAGPGRPARRAGRGPAPASRPAAGRPGPARRGSGRPARSTAAATGPAWPPPRPVTARMVASGVRSSCEALATNRRCAANATPAARAVRRWCRRGPSPRRPARSRRAADAGCRSEIRRVAAVIGAAAAAPARPRAGPAAARRAA